MEMRIESILEHRLIESHNCASICFTSQLNKLHIMKILPNTVGRVEPMMPNTATHAPERKPTTRNNAMPLQLRNPH